MQFWSADKKKGQLFSLALILSLPLWVGTALFMFFPNDQHFEEIFNDAQADGVSIAYLQQLLRSSPADFRLRHKLAAQFKATGQFNDAWDTLQPFSEIKLSEQQNRKVKLLKAEVSAQLGFSAATPAEKEQWHNIAITLLTETNWKNASLAELERLTALAPSIGLQSLTADLYLLQAEADSNHRARWLNKAALWKLAAGQGEQAGEIYSQMASQIKACDNCHDINEQTLGSQFLSSRELRKQAWNNAADAFLGQERYQDVYSVMLEAIATMGNDPETLVRGINIAIALESYGKAYQWLEQLLSLELNLEQLKQAQTLSMNAGAMDLALEIVQRRLPLEPDNPELHRSLAQFYQWNQKPQQAMDHWLWLYQRNPDDQEAFSKAWQLAKDLFHYRMAIKLLEGESKKRTLEKYEFDSLLSIWVEIGWPEKAEQALKDYLKDSPDHLDYWLQLTKFLEDQQKLDELADTWQQLHQHFKLSQAQFLKYMQVLQITGRLEQAVALLNQQSHINHKEMSHHEEHKHDHEAFWKLLADLAWRTESDDIAAKAIAATLKEDPYDEVNIDRYLGLASYFSPEQRLRVARQGLKAHKKPVYANAAMELAILLKKWDQLEAILKEVEPYEKLTNHYVYWLSKAHFSVYKGDVSEAVYAYDQTLKRTGPNRDIIASYLWFLLSERQLALIEQKITQWDKIARKEPKLWSVVAASWSALGEHRQAIAWYRKALKEQPDDPLLNLALADTLIISGWTPQAWQIRKKTLKQLHKTKDWLADPQWRPYHIQSRVWLAGLANSIQWIQGSNTAKPELWLTDLSALLIQAGNLPAATEWLSQHQQQQKTVPLYQLLAIALQGDKDALEPLLAKLDDGPERIEALKMLGYNGEALTLALGEIRSNRSEDSLHQLTEQAVALTTEYPSGWRIRGLNNSDGSLRTYGQELTLAHRFNRWHLQLDLESLSFKHKNNRTDAQLDDQLGSYFQATRLTKDGHWRGYTDVALRSGANRYGLGLEQLKRWNNYTSTRLFADYQGKSSVTSLMETFGQQNRIGADLNYIVSGSDRLFLSSSYSQYSGRSQGIPLGSGYHLQAAWQHQLFYRDPEWLLKAGIDWQDYNLSKELQLLKEKLKNDPNSDPEGVDSIIASLLPEQYHYFYISSLWQHGSPGALNARVPSPRWLFGVTLGYLKPQNTFSYSIETGLGWRLFGNDELSLTAAYNSSPPGSSGSAGYKLSLSYQHRLGQ
ncbi:tetratricopeptide repeat protein [Endozoicomonas sp. Mp262]|uniref:tetratricopeptide repeat protein n=1 Tax=Endozoicomonas sp. Mp262 TaxID=2919499 RepID=UPI0021D85BB4